MLNRVGSSPPSPRALFTRELIHARLVQRCLVQIGVVSTLLAVCSLASAQATSWLYAGGGAAVLEQGESESVGTVQVDAGLGTSAAQPLVLGGLFRLQSYFGEGSDLGLVARLASGGFARGNFGLGLDAGVYQRWWGEQGGPGFVGNLVLGGPWGVTLLAGAALAADDQRSYFASLGIDLARLTVHRHSGLNWFSNPMSSPREPAP